MPRDQSLESSSPYPSPQIAAWTPLLVGLLLFGAGIVGGILAYGYCEHSSCTKNGQTVDEICYERLAIHRGKATMVPPEAEYQGCVQAELSKDRTRRFGIPAGAGVVALFIGAGTTALRVRPSGTVRV